MLYFTSRIINRLFLVGLIFINTSCVIIPVGAFTKAPYPKEVLQQLAQQDTTRNDIRKALGSPRAIRGEGRYWFYGNERAAFGIIGGSSSVVINDFEWLAFEFDASGRMRFMEHNDDSDGCLSNGICTDGNFLWTMPEFDVLTAPTLEDKAIKSSNPSPEECHILVYSEPMSLKFMTPILQVSIDGKKQGVINYKTFLFVQHAPGTAKLKLKGGKQEIIISCVEGETHYVRGTSSWPPWPEKQNLKEIAPVQEIIGAPAIEQRRLALPY